MSRLTRFTSSRTLPLAGIVLAAALIRPAAAQAQSPVFERALLNNVATPSLSRITPNPWPASVAVQETPATDEGSRALLGLTPTGYTTPAPGTTEIAAAPEIQLDGERALLGRGASVRPRGDGDGSWPAH
jgi:hypothetical protein